VVLDVFEKQRWIKTLKMMQFVGVTDIDFIGKWRVCAVGTIALMVIGFAAVAARGKNMLDIDFLGGSSVQILFRERQDIAQVRKTLSEVPSEVKQQAREQLAVSLHEDLVAEAKTQLGLDATQDQINQHVQQQLDELSELRDVAVSSVNLSNEPAGLRFQFNTSNRKIHAVETILKDLFPGKLANNEMTFTPVAMASGAVTPEAPQDAATTEPAAKEPAATDQPQSPGQPKENEGSAVSRGQEQLLALADVGEIELALAQNQEPATQTAEPAAKEPAEAAQTSSGDGQVATTTLKFSERINHDALASRLQETLQQLEIEAQFELANADYTAGSNVPFDTWELRLMTDAQTAQRVLKQMETEFAQTPVFPGSSNIGGKVAGSTRNQAFVALLTSLVLMVAYIWLRFEKVVFGLATVAALMVDVSLSLGALGISAYLAEWLGPVAELLKIDPFKIDLTIVAAILTIVGYSINDKIVVLDRIREVRGKSKVITKEMLNLSINQTLSRTLLTGMTTLFVLLILYFWGGTGIHGFAYCLFLGIIVGTYSSIYVATPILLWLMQPGRQAGQERGEPNFAKTGFAQDRQRA
jgi:SecD/SecF fusion protein